MLISAYAPIYNDDEEVIGYMGCDISADSYIAIRNSLFTTILTAAAIVMLIVIASFIFITKKLISNPIIQIAEHADKLKQLDLTDDLDEKMPVMP